MSKQVYSFSEPAVGCDAEGFYRTTDGKKNVPVVGLLGGMKGDPIECEGGGYLEDCVAWEINPRPATKTEGSKIFVNNIVSCINEIKRKGTELDLEVNIQPAVLFRKADLSSPQASVSGCSTSYCAWDVKRLPAVDLSLTNYRFASGDLHISWPDIDDSKNPYMRINLIRLLDIMIGFTEIASQPQTKRSEFYGKPGVHRPTPYGVEYKTPSNFWLQNEDTMKWAFDTCLDALERTLGNLKHKNVLYADYQKDIMHTFATWDKKRAREYLKHFDVKQFPST